jgi:TolB-like protein/DNA-binding winged helix-turn-helix (wHTH) protein
MSLIQKELYEFGQYSLDPAERLFSRDGAHLALTPKVFDTLVCLVRNRGRLLSKDELLKEVWPDTFVEEVNLAVNISILRKTLGENPQDGRFISTVPGHGYRFVAEVREIPSATRSRSGESGDSLAEAPAGSRLLEREGVAPVQRNSDGLGRPTTAALPAEKLPRVAAFLALAILLAAAGYLWFLESRRGNPASKTPSIAVLPFADLSPDKNQEYFSDGLAEELINTLAKIPEVRVVARSSAFQFKGKNEDLRLVGKRLGVANILEGSVRREGDHLRIRADLIRTSDGFQLWSESYDREINDVFAVQDEIALSVASALELKLLGLDGAASPARARGTNAEAYQAYLEGRYFFDRGVDQGNQEKALAFVDQAIHKDLGYAPAWALRSSILTSLVAGAFRDEAEGLREARQAADRAIALDPHLAAGYVQRGWVEVFNDWDWKAADASLKRAAQLEPGSAAVLRYHSYLYQVLGQIEEAIKSQQEAIALDPLRARSYLFLEYQLHSAGRLNEAREALDKALELNPQLPAAHAELGLLRLEAGHPEEALAQIEQEPDEDWKHWGEVLAFHALGRASDSDSALRKLIAARHKDWAFQIAQLYAYRGETPLAFEWLDRAYLQHDSGLTMMKLDPLLAPLRREPRFAELLKKMRLPS